MMNFAVAMVMSAGPGRGILLSNSCASITSSSTASATERPACHERDQSLVIDSLLEIPPHWPHPSRETPARRANWPAVRPYSPGAPQQNRKEGKALASHAAVGPEVAGLPLRAL